MRTWKFELMIFVGLCYMALSVVSLAEDDHKPLSQRVALNNDAVYAERLQSLEDHQPKDENSAEWVEYTFQLSNAEARMRDYAKAEVLIGKLIKLNPTIQILYYNLSVHLLKQGKYQKAAQEARHALEMDPDHSNTLLVLACCEWQLGNKENASALVKRARPPKEDDPDPSIYAANLASFYALVGDEVKVESFIDTALKIDKSRNRMDFFSRDVIFDPYRAKAWFINLVGKTLAE